MPPRNLRVGLYVDVSNLNMNGGFGMKYDVLRAFACREGGEPMRLNAYLAYDAERAKSDPAFKRRQHGFHSALREIGYKVIEKQVRYYTDKESGQPFRKANVDLDLAVDALLQSENLDRVVLATGDGDFVQVVRALQNRGCRVEVIGFENVSGDLRREADLYVSGFLIPNLLPIESSQQVWGEEGSRVRGICYRHSSEKGYGFFRYLKTLSGPLWKTDSRETDSPYETIFFHDSELPHALNPYDLPGRDLIFEFAVAEGSEEGKYKAVEVQRIEAPT